MRRFIIHLLQFLIIPIFCLIVSFFSKSEIEKKRELLNKTRESHNIIIMGDSKSVANYNYKILKNNFPNHNIINTFIWAKNPQFNYSVYQDVLKNKKIKNSIVIYNATYRHLLNKSNKEWKKWNFKAKIDALLGNTHKFKHTRSENGFINNLEQDFKAKKFGVAFYKSLETKYEPNFSTQISYLVKLQDLIEKDSSNLLLIADLPYDSIVNQIYSNSEYYSIYKKHMHADFEKNTLNFNYMPGLNNTKYWFNHDHLHYLGAKAFTPIFCDSLRKKIKTP
ncbi:MAG: hypothetical protein H8E84_06660 [Flavobacteriales bacterium]|nr:hypothetical protein [Flavobacteriales bacterium]